MFRFCFVELKSELGREMRLPSVVQNGHGEITIRSYGSRFRVKFCGRSLSSV